MQEVSVGAKHWSNMTWAGARQKCSSDRSVVGQLLHGQ